MRTKEEYYEDTLKNRALLESPGGAGLQLSLQTLRMAREVPRMCSAASLSRRASALLPAAAAEGEDHGAGGVL